MSGHVPAKWESQYILKVCVCVFTLFTDLPSVQFCNNRVVDFLRDLYDMSEVNVCLGRGRGVGEGVPNQNNMKEHVL